jgi:hypothetical protein
MIDRSGKSEERFRLRSQCPVPKIAGINLLAIAIMEAWQDQQLK